jgi:KaiC/GvpD/RAD55 family RecA-like ATPase
MKTIKTEIQWLDDLIPEGFPVKTTTVITGPGGSGKPLIGEAFVSAWLKNGGSVIFISLQYPGSEFITESIKRVTGLNLKQYQEKIIFVQLDTEIKNYQVLNREIILANLVKPEVWEKVLNVASDKLPDEGPGILIFCSALNLLFFSPTYGEAVFSRIKETIKTNTNKTYLFSVSTSAKINEIAELERMADNLIISRSEKEPFRLFMKILRLKEVSFNTEEKQVPISPEILNHMKAMADHSRGKVLPAILRM